MNKFKFSLIAIVLVEIATFILVGKLIGVFNTLLLVVVTSIIGIFVVKKLGIISAQNIQNSINSGQPPGPAMVDTFLIFLGGSLLVIPGFITDILGFTMLIGFLRNLYKPFIYQWLRKKMENGNFIIINK